MNQIVALFIWVIAFVILIALSLTIIGDTGKVRLDLLAISFIPLGLALYYLPSSLVTRRKVQ